MAALAPDIDEDAPYDEERSRISPRDFCAVTSGFRIVDEVEPAAGRESLATSRRVESFKAVLRFDVEVLPALIALGC